MMLSAILPITDPTCPHADTVDHIVGRCWVVGGDEGVYLGEVVGCAARPDEPQRRAARRLGRRVSTQASISACSTRRAASASSRPASTAAMKAASSSTYQAMALAATAAGVRRVETATLSSFRRMRAGRATRIAVLIVAMYLPYHLLTAAPTVQPGTRGRDFGLCRDGGQYGINVSGRPLLRASGEPDSR